MRRLILITSSVLALSACTHMGSNSQPDPSAAAQLQSSPQIKAETATLNHLARIAIDANELYDDASSDADDDALKMELKALASERADFAADLQERVAALGGNPAEIGQVTGTFHRSFAALRGLVQDDSIVAAEEVLRGESYLIDELNKALAAALTPVSRDLVRVELRDVETSKTRVQTLKADIEARRKIEQEAKASAPQKAAYSDPHPELAGGPATN